MLLLLFPFASEVWMNPYARHVGPRPFFSANADDIVVAFACLAQGCKFGI